LFRCTLKTKNVSQFWWNGSWDVLLKSIKIHTQPFLKWITNLKILLNWPNGVARENEKREAADEYCVDAPEKNCVEAVCENVWEKRRRRMKTVWRLCGRRGEWGRRDGALGQRFLMGWRESDSCWGLFWGCRASGGFHWDAGHFTVFSLSSLPFYCGQSWKYIKFWGYRRKGLGCREKPPCTFHNG